MKTLFMVLALSLAATGCTQNQTNSTQEIVRLDVSEFAEKLHATKDAVLLDVRTRGEFANGHLPNSVNVDWMGRDFEKQVQALDKNASVFLYCQSGGRSQAAMQKLGQLGFTRVYEMKGGFGAWVASGKMTIRD
jgi:thioredoxin 1